MQPNFEEILNTIVMGNKDWSNTICSKEQAIAALQEVWNKANSLVSLRFEIPTAEKYGDKVLLYRLLNKDQKSMSFSIHDTEKVKYCNPDETWFMPLPEPPKQS